MGLTPALLGRIYVVVTAKKQTRTTQFPIRLSDEEQSLLCEAARRENLPVGTWLRRLGLIEARKLAKKAGEQ